MSETRPLCVRAAQAARMIGVSRSQWYQLQSSGRIPQPIKLGGCVLWKVSDLQLWLDNNCPNLERFLELVGQTGGKK